jgi:hypothetical protein
VKFIRKQDVPVLVASALLLAYLAALFVAGSSSDYKTDEYLGTDFNQTQTSASLNIDIVSVNINDNTLDLVVTPELAGDLGTSLATGSYVETPLSFLFDAYSEQTRWSPNPGEIQGAMPMSLRLTGEVDNYPFDVYEALLFASVQERESANPNAIPLLMHDKQEEVTGFSISSRQEAFLSSDTNPESIEADRASGVASLEWSITRSLGAILIVVLMGALIVIGAAVSILITISILRGKRPPSINSLSWLAAFLFALFSVRSQLPGSPPSGILFDVIVFYPSVLILVLLIAVNVASWVARDDWDMENPIFAVRGKFPDGVHEKR